MTEPEPLNIRIKNFWATFLTTGCCGLSQSFMHTKKLTSWLFLTFVVLFWNLGPSMHHADLFGFHSSDSESVSHCCCCCSHSLPIDSEDQPSGTIHPDGDCWLCDFFGQLHLVIEIEYESHTAQSVAFAEATLDQTADRWSVPAQARGPPRV